MGTYRLARILPSASMLLETSLGTSEGGKPVAILRFKGPWTQAPGFLDRFAPWQRGWQSLREVEGVLGFVEAGQAGTTPAVVQELVDAEPLRAALKTPGKTPFTLVESVAVMLQAVRGVLALEHLSPPLGHGDVSPSSLMLGADGVVKLEAVGLAAATPADPTLGPARSELPCLAPEEVDGTRGPRADIFRLGVVWLELLTGKTAFTASTFAELKARFEKFPGVTPAHFPSLPPAVAGVLAALLARAPGARPTASDLELVLTQTFEQLGGQQPSSTLRPAFARLFPGRASALANLAGGTLLTISTPSVKLGRISPKKVSAEEVAAAREQLAVEAAKTTAKEWTQAHSRDADNPKDFSLGTALLEQQKVTVERLDLALQHAQAMGGTLFEALCAQGTLDEDEALPLAAGLQKQAYLTGPQLLALKLGTVEAALLPRDFAEEWMVLPLKLESGALTVAIQDPSRMDVLDEVKARGRSRVVNAVRATERTLREGLLRVYDGKTAPPDWSARPATPQLGGAAMELEFELDGGSSMSPLLTTPPPQKNPLLGGAPAPLAMANALGDGGGLELSMDGALGAGAGGGLALSMEGALVGGGAPVSLSMEQAVGARSAAKASPHPDPLPRRGEGEARALSAPEAAPRKADGEARAGNTEVALRLLDAALALAGERGLEASAMVVLVRDVARQSGASGAPLEQVRLAVTAVVTAALMEHRRPYELPSRPSVAAALGPHWGAFEAFLLPLLDGTRTTDPRGVVIALCFELAGAVGAVPKRLPEAAKALEPLRARYPRPAVAALEAVLTGERRA